ncbi:MAG TPA: hypothetical protein VGG48_14930 [Rhizomicrobium sp.]|jgi:hypothetical protein
MNRKAPRWQWALAIATAVLLPVALLVACVAGRGGYGPPEIVNTADRDWLHEKDPGKRLTAALAARFPVGSDAGALEDELLREGFHAPDKAAPADDALEYRWSELPCENFVSVTWTADAYRRLTVVTGFVSYVCP